MSVVIGKQSCPRCGQSVNARQIALFADLVTALWQVVRWCEKRNRAEFARKEVKHLFTNENQSARFGDWLHFGGLVTRGDQKGHYRLNFEEIDLFFSGKKKIPTVVSKDPMTNRIRVEKRQFVHEIKTLRDSLTKDNDFIVRYRHGQPNLI